MNLSVWFASEVNLGGMASFSLLEKAFHASNHTIALHLNVFCGF
jgi:hypothetical protein